MERTVRIMQQSPLVTRKYMDRKTGDEKVINSVTLKLTDASIRCSVRWWFVSGIPSRPVRRCRPRRFTSTKSI